MGSINDQFMTKEQEEQYSFGPWLVAIHHEKLIPPQYLDHKDLILNAQLSVKVPVNKDRNSVTPGMLMYKEVLCFYTDKFIILHGIDKSYEEINYSSISYVIQGGELLNNYIVIGTRNKEYTITYYSVSFDITREIINTLRSKFREFKKPIPTTDLKYNQLLLYKQYIKNRPSEDKLSILAYQKEGKAKFISKPGSRISTLFKRKKLEEVLFLTNGYELLPLIEYITMPMMTYKT